MSAKGAGAPFLLFDDARSGGRAKLFAKPNAVFRADRLDEVRPLLEQVREASKAGFWCAGFLAYEAGLAFEPSLARLQRSDQPGPLGWFGVFDAPFECGGDDIVRALPSLGPTSLKPRPSVERPDYEAAVNTVLGYIDQGDIYQMNLTFQTTLGRRVDLADYASLRNRQRAAFGGIVATGEQTILSFSPELFFAVTDGLVTTRPMKGTAPRGGDPAEDAAATRFLHMDPKNRAENLMIVDLMRNDLGRIAESGSVRVPQLFQVETYPTIHQMTSTVTATLRQELDAVAVLEALFPCGSITGAPKLRSMELIRDIEASARGLYTGSIGWFAPNGDALFNVAIRTITVDAAGDARLGLGSGIVADSEPAEEWAECLEKAKFLQHPRGMGIRGSDHYKRGC